MSVIENKEKADEIYDNLKKKKSYQLSPEEALGLLVDCSLTKKMYQTIRSSALAAGHDYLPTYKKVKLFYDQKLIDYIYLVYVLACINHLSLLFDYHGLENAEVSIFIKLVIIFSLLVKLFYGI